MGSIRTLRREDEFFGEKARLWRCRHVGPLLLDYVDYLFRRTVPLILNEGMPSVDDSRSENTNDSIPDFRAHRGSSPYLLTHRIARIQAVGSGCPVIPVCAQYGYPLLVETRSNGRNVSEIV